MATRRKPGISVLIPTQNEEAVVEACVRSFLSFGDELIVVDNGSTDRTKEIVGDLAAEHPQKIKFFDKPELPDLYHNRAFALRQSQHAWIVRADSDYVCYTSGEYSILNLRDWLLNRRSPIWPTAVAVPQVNVSCDFEHTGQELAREGGYRANPERAYLPPVMSFPMLRFYHWFPGFDFVRIGRREYARFQRFMWRHQWPHPVWMHCNIKSDHNYLFRSERTNWRELGDFERYPTLESYVADVIGEKYGTNDYNKASQAYLRKHVFPYLERYLPDAHYPYPDLVQEQIAQNPIYRIVGEGETRRREVVDAGAASMSHEARH